MVVVTLSSSVVTDPVIEQLHNDLRDYVDPFTMMVAPTDYGTAYAVLSTNTVCIPLSLIKAYRSGKYNYNQLLHVAAHECGHLSQTGKQKAYANDADSESFADYYGLLLLEEMQHDGKNIDLYDVIKRFLIRNVCSCRWR